jgi:hypothetical protein
MSEVPRKRDWRAEDVRRREYRKARGLCIGCGRVKSSRGCMVCSSKNKSREAKFKDTAFQHYGMVCRCCGETTRGFLTFDHQNEDGGKQRREDTTSKPIARWLVKHNFPPGYQVLCWNCNLGKHRNHGVCPDASHSGRLESATAAYRDSQCTSPATSKESYTGATADLAAVLC